MRRVGIAFSFVAAACSSSEVAARAQPASFMPSGDVASPPLGFVQMCDRDRALCMAGQPAGPADRPADTGPVNTIALVATISFTGVPTAAAAPAIPDARPSMDLAQQRDLVVRVNRSVNDNVVQVNDIDSFGEVDRWNRLDAGRNPMGDCEDIAIEKRMRLMALGFPPERLFLAVAYKYGVGLHTVLIARLDDGDVVLDSLNGHVLPWARVPYQWLRIQSAGDPLTWRSPGHSPSTQFAAVDSASRRAAVDQPVAMNAVSASIK